jgi:hypothetical protein
VRRRLLVAVTAACVALSGCGAVRVSVERAPSPTTDEGVPTPSSSPSPSSSGRVVVGAEARRALERVVEDHPRVAIALAPVGGDGTPVTLGTDESLPAWSTIKVPLALAAHRAHPKDAATRADVEAAITASDNEAAARLWTGLGEPAQARRAVERVLREAGDRTTRVQDRQVVAGYSPFGQTRWRVGDQALFLAAAACAPDAAVVTGPMGRLVGGHLWGLAGLDGAAAKVRRRQRSRSSRASRRSASAPACTSAPPASAACTTSSGRSSTTRSTRPSPATPTPSTSPHGRRRGARQGQRPRHPHRHPPDRGVSAVELVLTQLHAGGKFGGGGYKVSGGLHGVGSSVVNALSTRLDVCVRQKGHAHRMTFDHGVPSRRWSGWRRPTAPAPPSPSGPTRTSSRPSTYDYETIRARFQQMAFLNKGLTINLVDERVEAHGDRRRVDEPDLDGVDADITEVRTTRMPRRAGRSSRPPRAGVLPLRGGLVDYVNHLVGSKKTEPVHDDVISIEVEDTERSLSLEIAMQWTTSYSESVHTYANTSTPTRAAPTRRASARR